MEEGRKWQVLRKEKEWKRKEVVNCGSQKKRAKWKRCTINPFITAFEI